MEKIRIGEVVLVLVVNVDNKLEEDIQLVLHRAEEDNTDDEHVDVDAHERVVGRNELHVDVDAHVHVVVGRILLVLLVLVLKLLDAHEGGEVLHEVVQTIHASEGYTFVEGRQYQLQLQHQRRTSPGPVIVPVEVLGSVKVENSTS